MIEVYDMNYRNPSFSEADRAKFREMKLRAKRKQVTIKPGTTQQDKMKAIIEMKKKNGKGGFR